MFFERHRATLDAALAALASRGYWSAYPETPSGKIYGETANDDAKNAFEAQLGQPFRLDQVASGTVGAERSPYGFDLRIAYPRLDPDAAIANAARARAGLRKAGAEARVGVCLEILARLNRMSFEIAYAVMHTTGQGFVMAFQAGGPHAQDRGLEATALAWAEMARVPAHARWEKPQGKNPPLVLDKDYAIVPKGIGLAIGCSTFPTWNTYPALFANLATGNPTLVKPHPAAVLPLAMTVRVARQVLAEAGLDPDAVQLMADGIYAPVAQTLARRPEIALIDYTGGPEFGDWLAKNAGHATLFAEKAGTNAVIVEGTDDAKGMFQNLAFSLCLYSGQMCTTPQNLFVPAGGVKTPDGALSPEAFGAGLAAAIDRLLGEPARAAEVLGAIQNPATLTRLDAASRQGKVVRPSTALAHPTFPDATVRTPLVVALDAGQSATYGQEMFGPIAYVVACADANAALDAAFGTIAKKGAITAAVYSTDAAYLARAEERAADVGVALSENLTGGVFVNQSAAFSDFHATGCNPAANASLTDAGFVAPRFHVAQMRRPGTGGIVTRPRVYAIDGLVPVVDPSSFVHPTAVLIGDVIVGPGCYIGPGASMRGDFGRLVMREGSNLQDNCVVHGFPETDTVLDVDAHIGHGAILHGCTIGRDALVGMNAVVMDGAQVGECAIVAAMAFVKAGFVVPPRTLVGGIPAKIMRELTDKEIDWKRSGTQDYKNLTVRSLSSLVECDALAATEPDRKRLSLKGVSVPLYKSKGG